MTLFRIVSNAVLLALLLAGCSTPDNSEPPAELTEIDEPERLRKLWSVNTGDGPDKRFFSLQPLVTNGTIFTIDTEGEIRAIDAASGDIKWKYDSGLASIAGLGGNDKSLLATSREGILARFDVTAEGAQERWRRQLLSEIRSRAVLEGKQVFVRTVDGHLTALDHDDGEVLWSISRRVPALSLTGNSHPIVHGDTVISGFDNGKLAAFDRENGSTVWEATVASPTGRTEIERLVDVDGQFLLRDGVVYVSSFQGNLAAVTANSGQTIWSRKFSSFQSMTADDDAIYVTDERSHVWAIDRRTGSAFWKQDALNARRLTAPGLLSDRLVVADLEGYVHFLDKVDGRIRARTQPGDERYVSQPEVMDSMVVVLDSTGQLTALAKRNK